MKIADVMKNKKQRVLVRVPVKLREKLGEETEGNVVGLELVNKNLTMVKVKVPYKGIHKFRPQDLSEVSKKKKKSRRRKAS